MSNYRTLLNSKKQEIQSNYLAKSYIQAQYKEQEGFIESLNIFYKKKYPLNHGGKDINLFRLFVERNLWLLSKDASLNYVLPSALMLEEGSYALRKEILENKKLMFFYGFENREGIFRDVDSRYKFALMQVLNTSLIESDNTPHTIKTMFYKTDIESAYDPKNILYTSLQDIRALSPKQLALQEVRDAKDLAILAKCYKAYAPLSLEWLDFKQDLNTLGMQFKE